MKILNWKINPDLKSDIDEHYRTKFALSLANNNPKEIIDQITFDNIAPNLNVIDIVNFMNFVNKKFLKNKIKGIGLEVGAGPGFFSAILADNNNVENVYAVEVCENIVKILMPKISSFILGKNTHKVIGCVGEFDNLELEDNSIDFVFDFYSLHHSGNLKKTLSEINRILKPGGFIFCFDKVRGDYLDDNDLEKMLDKEYTTEAKKIMGVDPSIKLTRRMNGEREYRLKDWKSNFSLSGFKKFEHYNLVRCASNNKIIKIIKEIFSLLPPKLQIIFTSFVLRSKEKTANDLSNKNRVYTKLINNFPKEISLMVVYK